MHTCIYVFLLCVSKLLQSCPTLCNPMDCSPPGSPVPGILQARTLEWVVIQSEVAQFCPTLSDPMDCSLPDSSVHGILQARILEWATMASSRGSSQPRNQTCVSCSSCITGGFFSTGEAHIYVYLCIHVYIQIYTWEIWRHIHIKSGAGNDKPLSILAWKVPWTVEPGGLRSMGHKESDMTEHTHAHTRIKRGLPKWRQW